MPPCFVEFLDRYSRLKLASQLQVLRMRIEICPTIIQRLLPPESCLELESISCYLYQMPCLVLTRTASPSLCTHGQLQGRMQPSFAAAVRRFFCLHPKIGIAINMTSTVKGSAGKAHL